MPSLSAPLPSTGADAVRQILYTLLYIVPFYISKTTRPSPFLSRDAPSVIRARIQAAIFATVVNTSLTLYVLTAYGEATLADAFRLMGYGPVSIADLGRVLLLCCVLFAGPLFEAGVVEGGWREWTNGSALLETLGSLVGWRNFVVVCARKSQPFPSPPPPSLSFLCLQSPTHPPPNFFFLLLLRTKGFSS